MKTMLLVGSSIFEAWTTASDLAPDWRTVNRAIGGTVTSDWTEGLGNIVAVESPLAVLYYCGSNDVGRGISQDETFANVLECREAVWRESPAVRFAYFGIIKAPEKKGKWEIIQDLNGKIAKALKLSDLYIDTDPVFFPGTEPNTELFVEDGLHLTAEAYARLCDYAAPVIGRWLDNVTMPNKPSPPYHRKPRRARPPMSRDSRR